MLNDNNFIKWLALKRFKFKEMKSAMLQKLQTFVFFMKSIFSLLVSTLNVILKILNDTE